MKIAMIGNCQRVSIAQAMRTMHNGLEILEFDHASVVDGSADLKNGLKDCQFVVTQKDPAIAQYLDPAVAKNSCHIVYYPRVYFEAFHPDIVYVHGHGGFVQSPLADYNSKIVFFAYLRGLSVDDTLRLFNADTYKALGYFNLWAPSKKILFHELSSVDFPTDEFFSEWARHGCFMHSINHPKLVVLVGIACILLERLALDVKVDHPEDCLIDHSGVYGPVWPVYPEIAFRYGLPGCLQFKVAGAAGAQFIDLREFVSGSFDAYAKHPREEFTTPFISFDGFAGLFDRAISSSPSNSPAAKNAPLPNANSSSAHSNPYKGLPSHHFWRKAVECVPTSELDPVVEPRFLIARTDKVTSAGSCFAQHISKQLQNNGFNYYVAEAAPPGISQELAQARSFGVFSARYGNIYTARQLVQLFDRAHGDFEPSDTSWQRPDGRLVDPFRPQIEADGFQSLDELEASRDAHLAAVRRMFERLNVLTFTLGLTEGWCSKRDGAVFPLAPGVAGGEMDDSSYQFMNFTVDDVIADLNRFFAQLGVINAGAKVILTVSPVPLIATYEDRHVLQATTYSKAVLRVAAEMIRKENRNVDYFPSYEIITGQFNRGAYFEDDLRSVKKEGVEHVMRLFLKHFTAEKPADREQAAEMARGFSIVCDEERIESSVA